MARAPRPNEHLRTLYVSIATHERLSDYCKKRGLKIGYTTQEIIEDFLNDKTL